MNQVFKAIIGGLVTFFGVYTVITLALQMMSIQGNTDRLETYEAVMPDGSDKYGAAIRLKTMDNQFFCSGVVIDGQYALTAAHCVKGAFGFLSSDDIKIFSESDIDTKVVAKAVSLDDYRDIALLQGDFKSFMRKEIQTSPNGVLTGMVACGFPSGGNIYCSLLQAVGNHNFLIRATGMPIYKGMSGGPVVDIMTDKVIGVNSAVDGNSIIIGPVIGALENLGIK